MKELKVPHNGKGRRINYTTETIDLSMTPIGFLNVYAVFVADEELKELVGEHFTILHNSTQTIKPCFDTTGNIEIDNLKKTIAQQIMNDVGQ